MAHWSPSLPAAMGDFLSSRSWIAVLASTMLLFSDPNPQAQEKPTHKPFDIPFIHNSFDYISSGPIKGLRGK